jgi:MFS family permease
VSEALSVERRFDSFSVNSFRWFFLASLFLYGAINSLLMVRGYLVFHLTGSFAALGTIALSVLIPAFFATLYGGVIADRMSKRLLIAVGLSVMGLFALWIGSMLVLDRLAFWHVMLSSAVHGGAFGLISAAWYSVTAEVVPQRMIMNAVSWTMGGQNITRLVMPAVFGYILSLTTIANAYFLMCALFFLAALLMLRVRLQSLDDMGNQEKQKRKSKPRGKHFQSFVEGITYTRSQPAVAALVLANMLLSGLSLPFLMLLPGYVKDVLQAGPEGLGLMVSFTSIGALVVTFFLTTMTAVRRGIWFLLAGMLMGLSLIAFVIVKLPWGMYPLLALMGAGLALRQSLAPSLCQAYVAMGYRGRVGSLISMQMTAGQIGTFLIGWLADISSVQMAFIVMGALLAACSAGFLLSSSPLRRMK